MWGTIAERTAVSDVPVAPQVTAQHILLGLIAEGCTKDEYMGSGITLEAARSVVESMSSKRKRRDVKELPFSRDSKRVFEAALTVWSYSLLTRIC